MNKVDQERLNHLEENLPKWKSFVSKKNRLEEYGEGIVHFLEAREYEYKTLLEKKRQDCE